jgi:hypothetical protein
MMPWILGGDGAGPNSLLSWSGRQGVAPAHGELSAYWSPHQGRVEQVTPLPPFWDITT